MEGESTGTENLRMGTITDPTGRAPVKVARSGQHRRAVARLTQTPRPADEGPQQRAQHHRLVLARQTSEILVSQIPASNPSSRIQSEPNAFADMPGCAIPNSEFRVPSLEDPSPSSIFAALTPDPSPIRWARGTSGLSSHPSNPPSPGGFGGHGHTRSPSFRNRSATARTAALSFALWLRKTSSLKSFAIPAPSAPRRRRG